MKKKIKFVPGDNHYRWSVETDSPFQKRNLAVFPLDSKLKAKLLVVKKRYYELLFNNEKEAYLARNQSFELRPAGQKETKYLEENQLKGNIHQIQFSISRLLERVISGLEENPQSLFSEAKNISKICDEENYPIPEIEAFNTIKSWDEFITLINSINENKGPFKFELLISAVTQYTKLCARD